MNETLEQKIIHGLVGSEVDQVRIGFDVQLVMGRPDGILQIGSPATLGIEGDESTVDPSTDVATGAVVLRLLRTAVESATVDGGSLMLRFSSGAVLHVPADEDYEAWSWAGSDQGRVVSMPGGELAVWSPGT